MSKTDFRFFGIIEEEDAELFNSKLGEAFGQSESETFAYGLSANGQQPQSHRYAYTNLSQFGLGVVIGWVCDQVSIPIPDFASFTVDEKLDWLSQNKSSIESHFGGRFEFHPIWIPDIDWLAIVAEEELQLITDR